MPSTVDIILSRIKPEKPEAEGESPKHETMELYERLDACAAELVLGVEKHDHRAVSMALKSAFEILESMPHVEGEHIEGEDD